MYKRIDDACYNNHLSTVAVVADDSDMCLQEVRSEAFKAIYK